MRQIVAVLFCLFLASSARAQTPPSAAPDAEGAVPDAAAPAAVPAAVPATRPQAREASLPFRLGLFFAKAFGQNGTLAAGPPPAAVGVDIAFGIGHSVRFHLGIANEWESRGTYAAKGFRLDLVSLGFPIEVVNDRVVLHIEPIARVLRGEILFPSQNGGGINSTGALFRIESGFAVAITAAMAHWFVAIEPLSLDIRSFTAFTAGAGGTSSGYSRLWWYQITAGREF